MTHKTHYNVIVCGGRDFIDEADGFRRIDQWCAENQAEIGILIHGAARGADTIGGKWGAQKGGGAKVVMSIAADWAKHGRSAGPIRNRQMLNMLLTLNAGRLAVLALPTGRGTANMMKIAEKAGVTVFKLGW